jgi:acyl-CoA thioesterase FadM
MLLGHEAAGRVVETGAGVTAVTTGQRVVMTFLPRCGECAACATAGQLPCAPGSAAINSWIIRRTGTRGAESPEVAVVAESGCKYFRQLEFPDPLLVGIRVQRLGNSSVTYDLAIFPAAGDEPGPIAARGRWVHVYVDRATRRPVPIPAQIRRLLTPTLGQATETILS